MTKTTKRFLVRVTFDVEAEDNFEAGRLVNAVIADYGIRSKYAIHSYEAEEPVEEETE